jgi:hypothetical protein
MAGERGEKRSPSPNGLHPAATLLLIKGRCRPGSLESYMSPALSPPNSAQSRLPAFHPFHNFPGLYVNSPSSPYVRPDLYAQHSVHR